MRRRVRNRLALLVVAVSAACWERPLSERLTIAFREDGLVTVRAETELRWPGELERNPTVAARLEERSRAVVEGRSPWADPFARAEPESERFEWVREQHLMQRAVHEATVSEVDRLYPILRACGADLDFSAVHGITRLTIFPFGRGHGSERDRRAVDAELRPWIDAVVRYGQAVEVLTRYVERNRERSEAVYGALFHDQIAAESLAALPQPTDEEMLLLAAYDEATSEVTSIGQLDEAEGTTLDERAQVAYSPFCGEIVVTVPLPPSEVIGFERRDDELVIPRADLLRLLLAGTLSPVTPDPLAAQLRHELRDRDGGEPAFDLTAWLAASRAIRSADSAATMLRRVKESLSPADRYEVSWMQGRSD